MSTQPRLERWERLSEWPLTGAIGFPDRVRMGDPEPTSVEPLRQVRDHFSDVVDRVEREHERVTVTRNGRAAAVIISPEDLAELEETLAVLSESAPWRTSAKPTRRMRPVMCSAASPRSARCALDGRRGLRAGPDPAGCADRSLRPARGRGGRGHRAANERVGREPSPGGEAAAPGSRGDPFRATRHVPHPLSHQRRARRGRRPAHRPPQRGLPTALSREASHLVSTLVRPAPRPRRAVAAPSRGDLPQAMTWPPFKKYQAEGGPSVKNVARWLTSPGPAPRMCRHRVFARTMVRLEDGAAADLAWSQGDSNPNRLLAKSPIRLRERVIEHKRSRCRVRVHAGFVPHCSTSLEYESGTLEGPNMVVMGAK
jgi:prevent-host-death family protein